MSLKASLKTMCCDYRDESIKRSDNTGEIMREDWLA